MAENIENNGCAQRDSAEHEGYVKVRRSFDRIWEERDSVQPKLLEAILHKDNFNRAYKKVEANKGAPSVDGMPIYEPLFADGSYGYRPNREAKGAILKAKEYAEQGYTYAVVLDLSRYFDTINHEILINLLRKNIKDERLVQLIKRYLKSGVMENGVVTETEEGSPQGGNLSHLLANIYLNEFDWEFLKRGVPCIRYTDDIVLLAKSKRESERLLESSTRYLEEKLKLTVNREKSRTVNVFAIRNFKFLGFALGRNGSGMENGKQQIWLLVYNTHSLNKHGNDIRKTDKQWLL